MTTRKRKSRALPADDDSFSLISNEKLRALYIAMLQCRMLQERMRLLARGKRRAALPAVGREAAAAGILIDLLAGDTLCAPIGDVASCFVKGVPLRAIFSQRGVTAAFSAKANVLPRTENFADRLELALRAARLGAHGEQQEIAVLILDSREAADNEWEDALRLAASERLPLLFVCHGRPRDPDLARQAQRCGLPGITVDEEDVVALYRVASEAIAHARRGNGPTLIEYKRWILQGKIPRTQPRAGNSVRNMEAYLTAKSLFDPRLKAKVAAQFERKLDKAAASSR